MWNRILLQKLIAVSSQDPAGGSSLEIDEYSPHPHTLLLSLLHLLSGHFSSGCPIKIVCEFSHHPYMLHVPFILSSFEYPQYMINTSKETPYAFFSVSFNFPLGPNIFLSDLFLTPLLFTFYV
jgi:hypothetical protein